jgi:hypothetical protein
MSYQTSAIAAIVALVFIMGAVVLGLGIAGRLDASSTPLIVSIFGMIATTVAALLSVIRTDSAVIEAKKTNGEVSDLLNRMEISDPGGRGQPHG